jgi:hypothetical protein
MTIGRTYFNSPGQDIKVIFIPSHIFSSIEIFFSFAYFFSADNELLLKLFYYDK